MKSIFLLILLISSSFIIGQIGLGTNNPKASSILDIASSTKGLLTPRMTSLQRDSIENPAEGLLIYNTSTASFNYFDLVWKDFSTAYKAVSASEAVTTNSILPTIINEMTITPPAGTYLVEFNGQYSNFITSTSTEITSTVLKDDLRSIIQQLDAFPITISNHLGGFGNANIPNGEIIYPGVYFIGEAVGINNILTLDGQGDVNSKFIIKSAGAINSGIGAVIQLINGASANNVFWVANGAMSIGANNTMKGNLVSVAGAVAVGIDSNLEGRMLSTGGYMNCGSGSVYLPSGPSFINFGILATFEIFTGAGGMGIVGAPTTRTTITGNVASADCAAYVNFGTPPPSAPLTLIGKMFYPCNLSVLTVNSGFTDDSLATFSIYKNGIEILNSNNVLVSSVKSEIVTLQSITTVNGSESIDIRWKTAAGNALSIKNRIMTLTKVR